MYLPPTSYAMGPREDGTSTAVPTAMGNATALGGGIVQHNANAMTEHKLNNVKSAHRHAACVEFHSM